MNTVRPRLLRERLSPQLRISTAWPHRLAVTTPSFDDEVNMEVFGVVVRRERVFVVLAKAASENSLAAAAATFSSVPTGSEITRLIASRLFARAAQNSPPSYQQARGFPRARQSSRPIGFQ